MRKSEKFWHLISAVDQCGNFLKFIFKLFIFRIKRFFCLIHLIHFFQFEKENLFFFFFIFILIFIIEFLRFFFNFFFMRKAQKYLGRRKHPIRSPMNRLRQSCLKIILKRFQNSLIFKPWITAISGILFISITKK